MRGRGVQDRGPTMKALNVIVAVGTSLGSDYEPLKDNGWVLKSIEFTETIIL